MNTKWFFERMRGQYTDTRANLNELEEKNFKNEFPKKQMLTKTDIAKSYDYLGNETSYCLQ